MYSYSSKWCSDSLAIFWYGKTHAEKCAKCVHTWSFEIFFKKFNTIRNWKFVKNILNAYKAKIINWNEIYSWKLYAKFVNDAFNTLLRHCHEQARIDFKCRRPECENKSLPFVMDHRMIFRPQVASLMTNNDHSWLWLITISKQIRCHQETQVFTAVVLSIVYVL